MSNLSHAVAALSSTDTICSSCGHSLAPLQRDPLDTVGTDGIEEFSSHQLIPGTLLAGRYRIVALIGQGGMGEVYQADDLTLEQPVALKFLPPHLQGERAALARFHREVSLSRKISHPNVCRVFDVGYADGLAFITMEYVGGEDLRTLMERIGRLAADKALEVARQLCAGLAAAHDEGVLHRDLKPANIMLDRRGNVRITDFGLAAPVGESGSVVAAGTPVYMAPEQMRGQQVSVQSDLYSLGLVLWEIFTGKPTRTEAARPEIPVSIERIISKCLEADVAKRPSSASEVGTALAVEIKIAISDVDDLPRKHHSPLKRERILFVTYPIAWSIFGISLLGLGGWLVIALKAVVLDHPSTTLPAVLFIWAWCIGAQTLLVFLAIGYLLQQSWRPSSNPSSH